MYFRHSQNAIGKRSCFTRISKDTAVPKSVADDRCGYSPISPLSITTKAVGNGEIYLDLCPSVENHSTSSSFLYIYVGFFATRLAAVTDAVHIKFHERQLPPLRFLRKWAFRVSHIKFYEEISFDSCCFKLWENELSELYASSFKKISCDDLGENKFRSCPHQVGWEHLCWWVPAVAIYEKTSFLTISAIDLWGIEFSDAW